MARKAAKARRPFFLSVFSSLRAKKLRESAFGRGRRRVGGSARGLLGGAGRSGALGGRAGTIIGEALLRLLIFVERRFDGAQTLCAFRVFGRQVFGPLRHRALELVFLYVGYIDNLEGVLLIALFDDAVVLPTLFERGIGFLEILLVGHVGDAERDFQGHLRQLGRTISVDPLKPNLF